MVIAFSLILFNLGKIGIESCCTLTLGEQVSQMKYGRQKERAHKSLGAMHPSRH